MKTTKHAPADIAAIREAYSCSDRHARRLLAELGRDNALSMAALQLRKLLLQIERLQIEQRELAAKYMPAEEVKAQARKLVAGVNDACDKLVADLSRRLPGLQAAEMAPVIQDAVFAARNRMSEMAGRIK